MIVFEKEQVFDNRSKPKTTSGLTSGLRATLKKGQLDEKKEIIDSKPAEGPNTQDHSTKVGTGGTSLSLQSRELDSSDVVGDVSTSPFCCKVFFANDRSVICNVTEDITISNFVQSVFVGCVSNAEQFQNLEVTLYAADSKGDFDDDCPVLDDRRSISSFGITNFVFKSNKEEEFEKIELNADVVNIGPVAKEHLTEPLSRLFRAAEIGHLDEVRTLIEDKLVDVSATGIDDWTALHFAARQGHLPILNCLLKKGANIDALTKNGWSPLHLCSYQGHVEIGEIILTCGAEPNIADNQGKTPLDYAKQQQQDEMVEVLEDFIEEEKQFLKEQ